MKFTLAVMIAAFLHSQLASGMDPTYDELKNQLPIDVNPNGDDQYFFFIVPVQKNDEPNVILQMAQAQSSSESVNGSFASTVIDTGTNSVNTSIGGEDANLNDIFKTPEDDANSKAFNFQVPVIVPLDFRFKYDPATATESLPKCAVDSRTWKEKVISRIAEKMEFPGEQSWDHTDLNVRIRLKKDTIATITLEDITIITDLSNYVTTIHETKMFADIRYSQVIGGIVELKAEHVSLIAEGLDTYTLIDKALQTAKDKLAAFKTADPSNIAIEPEELRIAAIENGVTATIQNFTNALKVVKDLQAQEDMDEDDA